MANRTKPKQRKIYLSEEKNELLNDYLKRSEISLQDLLEQYIDEIVDQEQDYMYLGK